MAELMIHSMTAFAAATQDTNWGRMSLELRSVNHRYLEVNMRLPEELRPLEGKFRERIGARLNRGKVDLSLKLRRETSTASVELRLNQQLAGQLTALEQQLRQINNHASPSSSTDWLRWPGMVIEPEQDLAPLQQAALDELETALDDLVAFRRREGDKLGAMIEERLAGITRQSQQMRAIMPEIRDTMRGKLNERIEVLQAQVEADRIEQEVVMLLQKLDIDEELDRLNAHVSEVKRTLDSNKPIGRRLDFLMQELNREANTLGSKSADTRMTQAAVELKVLIEQMREQVQNIE